VARPDAVALRRPTGPLLGLRGAPRTRTRLARRTWVPSARTAFGRPPGFRASSSPPGLLRSAALLALSLPFKGLSQHPRTVPPAPEGADCRTMLPLLGFAAPRHMPGRRIRSCAGLPAPHRATSEVWLPPSRRPPPTLRTLLRRLERPRACPFKAFSSHRSGPLSGASTLRAFPARFRGPLRDLGHAVDFRASIPVRARSVRRVPKDPARRCLPGLDPSRAFAPSVRPCALIARVYPITRWAV